MRYFLTALSAIILLASCGKMKKPELIGLDDVKVRSIGIGKSNIIVYVKLFNPNSFKGKLKHAEGDAWIDSTYLGHFTVDTVINVPAKSEFIVPVNIAVDMFLGVQALSIAKKEEVLVKVDGKVRAGRNGFYKNIPLKFEEKHDPGKLLTGGYVPKGNKK
jgi:LEA14-like dessication related protein